MRAINFAEIYRAAASSYISDLRYPTIVTKNFATIV